MRVSREMLFIFGAVAVLLVAASIAQQGDIVPRADATVVPPPESPMPPSLPHLTPEVSVDGIPPVLINYLRSSESYEDFMARVTRALRQYANGSEQITAEQVKALEQANKASQRANIIQSVLRFDLDADGKVTKEEVQKASFRENRHMLTQIDQWDANKDGVIEITELLKAPIDERRYGSMRQEQQQLMELDPNKDGVLTIAELKTLANAAFKQVDTDNNGLLSNEERNLLQQRQREIQQTVQAVPSEKWDIPADAELYVVGVYEGNTFTPDPKKMAEYEASIKTANPRMKEMMLQSAQRRGVGGTVHGPVVDVNIKRSGKKVALVLLSYEPVRWRLQGEGSMGPIYVNQERSEVLLNKRSVSAKPTKARFVYQKQGRDFRSLLDLIKASTGRDKIDGFVGAYRAPQSGFAIDAPSADAELKTERLVVADPKTLPQVTYRAILNGKPGEYDLSGKMVKSLAMHQVLAAYVPTEKRYYSIGNNGLKVQDEQGVALAEIQVSLDVPSISHPTGVAFDSKRNRVILSTLGGEGFLYAYDIATKKWSVLSSLNQVDLANLSYDAVRDRIVSNITLMGSGIAMYDAQGQPIVDPSGKKLVITDLPGFKDTFDPGNDHASYSVQATGKYYVLMVGKGRHPILGSSINPARIYLIDPDTWEAKLTYANPV